MKHKQHLYYYPGDKLAHLTCGTPMAAVVYRDEVVKEKKQGMVIDRIKVESSWSPLGAPIGMCPDPTTLAAYADQVVITKLVHRPWWNHLRALFNI